MADTRRWRHSLKQKLTLGIVAIFVVGIWGLSYYATRMLREDLKELLANQQVSTVSYVAAELNQALVERIQALQRIAQSIDRSMLRDPAALQKMLGQQPVFQDFFNAGVVAVDRDGIALADAPVVAGRRGTSYASNEGTHLALTEGKTVIGRPVIGRVLKQALFNINAPIRDADGTVIGALFGVINLAKPSFLDRIGQHRYGKSGGYLVVAPQYNLFVTASDKSRVMQPLPPAGTNAIFDKRLQGYDRPEIAMNSLGVETLSSSARIPVAGWFVVATLPTDEAFSPIHVMQQRIVFAAIFLTLIAGVLSWWLLRSQLSPLVDAARTLSQMTGAGKSLTPLTVVKQDEIGQLIGGFNELLETLGRHEAQLQAERDFFSALLQQSSDGVFLYREDDLAIDEVNPSLCRMLGYRHDELLGMKLSDLVQADAENTRPDALHMTRLSGERSYRKRDGTTVYFEVTVTPVEAGDARLFMANLRDITGRKRVERVQSARVRLMEYSSRHSLKDLLVETLDEAGLLTDSPIGFYHFLEADQKTLSLQAWSTRTTREFCQAAGEGRHYSVDAAGVWVECIHARHPVIHNDYASLPDKRGLPAGHAAVVREMVVPVFRNDAIVAILGVGNKAVPYVEADLEMVAELADLAWGLVEIKRAEEALHESEERWKFALEGAGDGVWDWNVHTGEVNFSRRWQEMLGYAEGETGSTLDAWQRLVHPDDLDKALATIQTYLAGEIPALIIEHRLRCKDGSWKWILSRGMIVSTLGSGKALRMIGTHSDITERMEQRDWLERQVLERTAQLRAMAVDLTAAEERERHSVAQDLHDGLGQILAVAKLKLSALDFRQQPESSGKSLPQEVKEIEALLGQANHTMRSLSLQLSPPVLRELNLLAALHWLADEVERSFGLRVNLSDDGSPKPLDENMLKVVFRAARELLINAAKHSQADAVDVEALCEDGHLVLSVADTGVGFSPRSVPPPSARGGYGLFSVRDRLGFIGGTVQIDSSPGNGTVVVIRVPLGTRHHDA